MSKSTLVVERDNVVMASCSSGETSAVKVKRFSDLKEEKELKNPNPRFQLFSATIKVDRFDIGKPCLLSGVIRSGSGIYSLFKRHRSKPIRILNKGYIYSLSPRCSIPLYADFSIYAHLEAIIMEDDSRYVFRLEDEVFNLSDKEEHDTFCTHMIKGSDGYLELLYIILRDPVDISLEMTFHPHSDVRGKLFTIKIFAYYGGDYDCGGKDEQGKYSVKLLEADDVGLLENNKIPLNTSFLSVPTKASLKIRAIIIDLYSRDLIISTLYDIPTQRKGRSIVCMKGEGCSLEVNVNWKCEDATEEENDDGIQTLKDNEKLATNDELAVAEIENEDPSMITEAEPDHRQPQQQHVTGDTGDEPEQETGEDNREPLKNHPTPRFQLFSASIRINKYRDFKLCFLHGYISVSGHDHRVSPFVFRRCPFEPIQMYSCGILYPLAHPSSHCSVPVNTFLNIIAYLYVIMDNEQLFFEVSNSHEVFNLSQKTYDTFCSRMIKGADGFLKMIYIILKDPVDATLEMTFHPEYDVCGHPFRVEICAFYSGNDDWKGYRVDLLRAHGLSLLKNNKIPLNISCLAVPANGSLNITAVIADYETGKLIMWTSYKIHSQRKGSSNVCIKGESCHLEVIVNWKCEDATEAVEIQAGIQNEDLPKITEANHGQS